jgi:hypothetical protein
MTVNMNVTYHTITFRNPVLFSEAADHAGWGTVYYAMKTVSNHNSLHIVTLKSIVQDSNITYTVDKEDFSLEAFSSSGFLNDQPGIVALPNDAEDSYFAISRDLGTIEATQAPIVWAIGYTSDPAISYANQSTSSSQRRRPYYKSRYTDDESLVTLSIFWSGSCSNILVQIIDFLNDFSNASQRTQQLDQKILADAASVSDLLGDLVSLAVPPRYMGAPSSLLEPMS